MGTRLFVGNLSYRVTEPELREVFEESGRNVVEVKVVTDRDTGRSRGFAFVEMASDDHATQAIQALNGREVGPADQRGRGPGRAPRSGGGWGGGPGGGFGGRGRGRPGPRGRPAGQRLRGPGPPRRLVARVSLPAAHAHDACAGDAHPTLQAILAPESDPCRGLGSRCKVVMARATAMHERPPLQTTAPAILPPWGWSRRQLIARSSLWFSVVPRTFKPELIELCRSLARSGQSYETVARLKWPVAELALYGEQLLSELEVGSGIAYIVGLCSPEADVPDEVLRWAYLLIGLQMGAPVTPSTLLLDITTRNTCSRAIDVLGRSPQAETAFHTDSSAEGVPDLVGALCLRPARQGGEYQVSSALRARDVVWERGGHLIEELYAPLIREGQAAGRPPTSRPVFAHQSGAIGLRFDYARPGIETASIRAEQPLRPSQQRALDHLDQALRDPAGCVQFQMRRGDMLFVNNRLVAHNRRPFDDSGAGAQRLMVRMWLSTRGRQPVAPV